MARPTAFIRGVFCYGKRKRQVNIWILSFLFQDKIQNGLATSTKIFLKNAETEKEVTKLQFLS